MKIEVTKADSSGQDGPRITFVCPVGTGYASWCSSSPPVVGMYSVELDIHASLSEGHVVASLPDQGERLSLRQDGVRLCGVLEQMDDDGMGDLRLHDSCIIMVECKTPYPQIGNNVCMTLPPESFAVTPIGS